MKKIPSFSAILFVLFFALNIKITAGGTVPSSGDGSSGSPYQISSLDNLLWLSTTSAVWDKCFIQTADIDASATSTWNSDGSGGYYGFSPIGMDVSFTGSYDGNNHTISHLYIHRPDDDYYSQGLFGFVQGATIENLGLIAVDITGGGTAAALIGSNTHYLTVSNCFSSGSVSGSYQVGGLIGYTRNYSGETNTITNCFSTCSITAGGTDAGGLVGQARSTSTGTLKISNCYSSGSVSGTYNAGGLVGYCNYYCEVENCYSTADVSAINNKIGGLVGYNYYSSITNCYSAGSVSGSSSSSNVGGLVGSSSSATVTNSFWDTQTSGQSSSDGGTGKTTSQMKTESTFTDATWDFAGESTNGNNDYWDINADRNAGYPYLDWQTFSEGTAPGSGDGTSGSPYQIATLDNLLWISTHSSSWGKNFTQTADIDASSTEDWNLGDGFSPIGNETNKFTGVYNGNSHSISSIYINRPNKNYQGVFGYTSGATVKNIGVTNVDISGNGFSGGLAGMNESSSLVSHSYATGSFSGHDTEIGGLVGTNNATVSYCYSSCTVNSTADDAGGLVGGNAGTISCSYATGNVTTIGDEAGGLVGINWGPSPEINNCYCKGNVSGREAVGGFIGANWKTITNSYSTGTVTGTSYVGGFVGDNDAGTVNNSFWDTETSGESSSGGGTGKTTSEMKTKSTFTGAGWDFVGESTNGNNDYWDIDGSKNDGYPILYSSVVPTPVELISFTANLTEKEVLLNWQTATEVNNYGFEIERQIVTQIARNLRNEWETIGFIQGHGNSNSPKSYSFTDVNPPSGKIQYRLKQIDVDGEFEYSDEVEVNISAPNKFELAQNYPNPFNPTTTIKYFIPVVIARSGATRQSHEKSANPKYTTDCHAKTDVLSRNDVTNVSLVVYDLLGHEVVTLVNKRQVPGNYSIKFDASNLASGIYFYRLQTGDFIQTRKMVLMK
jgi:hypothetical protein